MEPDGPAHTDDPEDRPWSTTSGSTAGNLPDVSSVRPEDIPALVHQLHVHHVQLEMQNEELRQAQETLAESCDHYTQLYDFSPAGYVTLTVERTIEEANLRFCALMGVARQFVLKRPLSEFVTPQDWSRMERHCRDVIMLGTTQTCKLRLLGRQGPPVVVHVESLRRNGREGMSPTIQMAMLDITLLEHAEEAVRDSQRKMQMTAARLLTTQDEERRRIARELHDDFCQRLTALILEINMLTKREPGPWPTPSQQLKPIKAGLSELLTGLRNLSHELHPNQTAVVALESALRGWLADIQAKLGIPVAFHAPQPPVRLPATVSTALYRITQECLTNVAKHAEASQVSVTLTTQPESVRLIIRDDGKGFVPESVGQHHLGLLSMRERVAQLHGEITVSSRPGSGTTISIQLPLSPEEAREI